MTPHQPAKGTTPQKSPLPQGEGWVRAPTTSAKPSRPKNNPKKPSPPGRGLGEGPSNQPQTPNRPRTRQKTAPALALILTLLHPPPAQAISDPAEMLPNPTQEARAEAVGRQLRCLVCQNESIEDSNADLARDLRRIVRTRIAAGDTDPQVIAWLVARYGEFVRLNPPFNASTLLLWASPILAIAAGLLTVLLARRRRPTPPSPLTEAERTRLAELTSP